jgi:hypothetical protein
MVPVVEPFMVILTPGRGFPDPSFTVPEIVPGCPNTIEVKTIRPKNIIPDLLKT